MRAQIVNIRKDTDINSEIHTYKGITLFYQIHMALYYFYDSPSGEINTKHNPVFLHRPCNLYTPATLEETRTIMNKIKKDMVSYEKIYDLNYEEKYWEAILLTNFIITRERLTSKVVVLGFYNIVDATYRRYLIKDIKRFCKLMRVLRGDYPKMLGYFKKGMKLRWYHKKSKEDFYKQIYDSLIYMVHAPERNEHILEMMKVFGGKNNVYSLKRNSIL